MTMHIYGDSRSGNCLKIKWTANKLGIPFTWTEVDILQGTTRTDDYLRMNPAGQVPTVVLDDGRYLSQSNGVIIYLAEGSDLIPADAYDRAKMLEWMFWEQYSHEPYVAVARFHRLLMKRTAEEVEPRIMQRGEAALARIELQLQSTPYLVKDTLSLADVACVAYTRVAHEGGFDLGKYPAIQGWVARVEAALSITD